MIRFCLFTLVLIAGASGVLAQDISLALEEHLDSIEQVSSQLRGLEALESVAHRFPDRADLRAYLERELNLQLDEETILRETQFYIAFDLLPPDVDLLQVYLDFYNSPAGVAGFYDTESKAMNVLLMTGGELGDQLPLLDQITYAHEFTHALQDQHFGLEALLDDPDMAANPDRALAVLSLVEGDATAVMNAYLQAAVQQNPMAAIGLLVQGFSAGAFNIPPGTPPFVVTELTFPYQDGLIFVNALYREGGWEAVNRAYAELPVSTEQILHPARYLSGEQPLPVTLETTPPGPDWALLADRTLGEFYLRSYLDTQLAAADARKAADGWGGDRYHLYFNETTNQRAWALRLKWDSPADSAEFGDTITAFAEARFEGAPAEGDCWSGADAALCFIGGEVETRLAAAPSAEMARALLDM
ncbi:MAG: hypothetical protein HXY41_07180 [Chloroflexi bacterium]|nr:hypothetical protein [Chloroflexota bacterium]